MIEQIWGDRLVKGLRPKHVLQLRDSFADTPRKADHLVDMLSTLIRWGIPREFADVNPCADVPRFGSGEGWMPWEPADVAYASNHLPRHLWWVAAMALYTEQRQGGLLRMDWSTYTYGAISVKQSKTGKRLTIPIHKDLACILDEIPRVSTRILTNSSGVPWSTGFKSAWNKAMHLPAFAHFRERRLVFHELRKAALNACWKLAALMPRWPP